MTTTTDTIDANAGGAAFEKASEKMYRAALTSTREFSFTSLKKFEGRSGEGFSATVKRGKKTVGEVVDEGNGGAPFLRVLAADRQAFLDEAGTFAAGGRGVLPLEEEYVAILALAWHLSTRRSGVVIFDETDPDRYLSNGNFYTMRGSTASDPATTAKHAAAGPGASRNPLVWVKTERRFQPAASLTA